MLIHLPRGFDRAHDQIQPLFFVHFSHTAAIGSRDDFPVTNFANVAADNGLNKVCGEALKIDKISRPRF